MRYHSLFEPDVLIEELSGKAVRRTAALSSEKRLMLAVLRDALDCYQKYALADDRANRELFEEAAAWIECTNTDGLFSFESISSALDIEPAYFRRGLAEWHRRHLEARRSNGQPAPQPSRAGATAPARRRAAILPACRAGVPGADRRAGCARRNAREGLPSAGGRR